MSLRSDQVDVIANIRAGEVLSSGVWVCYRYDPVSQETRAYKALANDQDKFLVRGYNTQVTAAGQNIGLRAFGETHFATNVFSSGDIGKSLFLSNTAGAHTLDITSLPRNGTTQLVELGTVLSKRSLMISIKSPIGPLLPGPNTMSLALDQVTGKLVTVTSGVSSTLVPEVIPLSANFSLGYFDLAQEPVDSSLLQFYIFNSTQTKTSPRQILGKDISLVRSDVGGLRKRVVWDSRLVPGVDPGIPDVNDSAPTIGLESKLESTEFASVYYTV